MGRPLPRLRMSRKSQETTGPNVDIPATTESNTFQRERLLFLLQCAGERYLFAETYGVAANLPRHSLSGAYEKDNPTDALHAQPHVLVNASMVSAIALIQAEGRPGNATLEQGSQRSGSGKGLRLPRLRHRQHSRYPWKPVRREARDLHRRQSILCSPTADCRL